MLQILLFTQSIVSNISFFGLSGILRAKVRNRGWQETRKTRNREEEEARIVAAERRVDLRRRVLYSSGSGQRLLHGINKFRAAIDEGYGRRGRTGTRWRRGQTSVGHLRRLRRGTVREGVGHRLENGAQEALFWSVLHASRTCV